MVDPDDSVSPILRFAPCALRFAACPYPISAKEIPNEYCRTPRPDTTDDPVDITAGLAPLPHLIDKLEDGSLIPIFGLVKVDIPTSLMSTVFRRNHLLWDINSKRVFALHL